jgi:hypothetical protein
VTSLRNEGFDNVEVVTSREVAHAWILPEPDRRTLVVLFDAQVSDRGGDAN